MDQQNQNLFDLQIDQQSFHYFSESARWAKFLSIIGFIYCAFMVLIAFFAGAFMATMFPMMGAGGENASMIGGGVVTFVYIVLALVYFFPCLYLFRYASNMQDALAHNEQAKMQSSIRNLKSFFKFFGIVTIIMLALMVLGMVGMMLAGVGSMMT